MLGALPYGDTRQGDAAFYYAVVSFLGAVYLLFLELIDEVVIVLVPVYRERLPATTRRKTRLLRIVGMLLGVAFGTALAAAGRKAAIFGLDEGWSAWVFFAVGMAGMIILFFYYRSASDYLFRLHTMEKAREPAKAWPWLARKLG